jgi:hypothetical protein
MSGRALLLVFALTFAVPACARSNKAGTSADAPSATSSEDTPCKLKPLTLGPAVGPDATATRYKVPIPPQAQRDTTCDAFEAENPDAVGAITYYLPESVTLDQVREFYATHMPPGQPRQGSTWCQGESSTDENGIPTIQREWQSPGTDDYLVLTLVGEEPPHGAGLIVFDDRGDPGDCSREVA